MGKDLEVGDTIQCHDEKEMIKLSMTLAKEGYYTDWLDIKKEPPTKWVLTVVGKE